MKLALLYGFLAGACCFFAGRLSTLVWQNKEIQKQVETLKSAAEELKVWNEELKRKDKFIREQYQKIVVGAASLHAFYNEEDNGKWTETDDVFFSRWNSAE